VGFWYWYWYWSRETVTKLQRRCAFGFGTSNPVNEFAGLGAGSKPITAIKSAGDSFFSKLIPESTMGKVALAGGIGALALGE
jgi:hypothetical protein